MARTLTQPIPQDSPIATDLRKLGQLIRNRRAYSMLRIDDAAAFVGVSKDTLSRLENGRAVGTDKLMAVVQGLGLTCIIMDKSLADMALHAKQEETDLKESG